MKAQVEEENIHEESTRPISEEDHSAIEPCNPEPENPALPETAETTDKPEDNTDDYEQLKEEYLELLRHQITAYEEQKEAAKTKNE